MTQLVECMLCMQEVVGSSPIISSTINKLMKARIERDKKRRNLTAKYENKRAALPHSRIMIHQPLGGFQGQASDFEIHAKEILHMKKVVNDILAKHTGQSIKKIEKDTDRDNFLDASSAIKYGLVDSVLNRRDKSNAK